MFNSGVIDGAFELDDTSISGSRVGSRDATNIRAYNARFDSSQVCENLELLALGTASYLRCSDCYEGVTADEPLCTLGTLNDPLSGNYCRAWLALAEPPACGGDLPTRPNRLR